MSGWKPLSVRESGDSSAYDGPFEDVPDWMFGDLWDWVRNRYPLTFATSAGSFPRQDARADYRRIGMALGIALENIGGWSDADEMQSRLRGICIADRTVLLNVIDYWLAHDSKGGTEHIASFDSTLERGRSAWRVQRDNPPYLARRVSSEMRSAAEAIPDKPGEHIARGWRLIYGRSRSPSEGYREAVKAVEAAAGPIVSPANKRRTLGTTIRDLEAKPEKWAVRLRTDDPLTSIPAVTAMLDILWTGQSGRHADPDPAAPLDVSQEDAEAALHLALVLVHWFTTGVVTAK